jgi:hypothetical protein
MPKPWVTPESSKLRSPEAAAQAAVTEGAQGVFGTIHDYAVPALGGAVGFGLGGPPGAFVGAATADVADYYIRKWLGQSSPPPTFPKMLVDATGAAVGYGVPELAAVRATRGAPVAGSYGGQLPEVRKGEMVVTPQMQSARTQYSMGESVLPEPDVKTGTAPLLGTSATIDPGTLPRTQAQRYTATRAVAAQTARKLYAPLDRVLNHEVNRVPSVKEDAEHALQVGVTRGVGPAGEVTETPRYNTYPINTPVDYRIINGELEELAAAAKAMRIPEDSKFGRFLKVLTDPERDWFVSWRQANNDLAQLKRYAKGPDVGTRGSLQGAASKIIDKMQPVLDNALKVAGDNVAQATGKLTASKAPSGYMAAAAKRSLKAGNKSWAGYKGTFDTPEAKAAAKAGRSKDVTSVLGTADKGSPQVALLPEQFGPDAMGDWGRAQWQRSITTATKKGTFDPVAFDKTLWNPGMSTLKYLFKDTGALGNVIGPDAVRQTGRRIFDTIVRKGNYEVWGQLSQHTRELVAGGDPTKLAALDDFFSTAKSVLEQTPMTQGRARAVAQDILKFAGGVAAHATTPGAGGITQRQVIRMVEALSSSSPSTIGAMVARMKMWMPLPGRSAVAFGAMHAIPTPAPTGLVEEQKAPTISGKAKLNFASER